jgi:hypothetical protein
MRQPAPIAIVAAAVSICALAAPVAAQASTAARPLAAFSLTTRKVASGALASFRYSTKYAPAGALVTLQLRQYGASPSWLNVEVLNAAGAARVPALPTGVFALRIRVADGHRTLAVSPAKVLTVTPSAGGSGCSILCQILSGVGAGITTWLLQTGATLVLSLF